MFDNEDTFLIIKIRLWFNFYKELVGVVVTQVAFCVNVQG